MPTPTLPTLSEEELAEVTGGQSRRVARQRKPRRGSGGGRGTRW